jgi:hypothetical protein
MFDEIVLFAKFHPFLENLAESFSGCHTSFSIQHLFLEALKWTCTMESEMQQGH